MLAQNLWSNVTNIAGIITNIYQAKITHFRLYRIVYTYISYQKQSFFSSKKSPLSKIAKRGSSQSPKIVQKVLDARRTDDGVLEVRLGGATKQMMPYGRFAYFSFFIRRDVLICNSRNCFSSTSLGAWVIRSDAL